MPTTAVIIDATSSTFDTDASCEPSPGSGHVLPRGLVSVCNRGLVSVCDIGLVSVCVRGGHCLHLRDREVPGSGLHLVEGWVAEVALPPRDQG